MKKTAMLLMLLLCAMCLTGCMASLTDKTYYTTDTVDVVLENQTIGEALAFSEADLLAADEVALEGSISIFQDGNEVIVVPVADIVISSVSAPPDVSADEASIAIQVPYEDLELNTTYAVLTDSRLTVVLKKDHVEQKRAIVVGLNLEFTPTQQYVEPTPVPMPTPTPEPEWNLPRTGDDSFVSLWFVLTVASILGLGMMACKRKSA